MRSDLRPYWVKKLYLRYRHWYTEHFIRPKCDALGDHHAFMKPWHTIISGPNIRIGRSATVISEPEQPVRIGVWGREPGQGRIVIGDCVLISPGCRLSACSEILIGDGVMMANGVYITDSDWHGIYDRIARPAEDTPVHIGSNVWLGDHCMILKGVSIGENSVVGAGAVVTKAVPANVIVAGNPARVVRQLDPSQAMNTRMDFFADPVGHAEFFDQVDRMVLKENALWRWLRALVWPTTRD
jgi:acetyltransferase-like isoleucine patch superfamily enzyme